MSKSTPLILSFVRRRLPDIDAADLARPIYDLDVDSLDVVDLTHATGSQVRTCRPILTVSPTA